MTSPVRVLVLHASVGMGHQRAAEAVGHALAAVGATDVLIEDTLDHGRTAFRRVYRDLYLRLVEHAPSVWNAFYTHTDRAPAVGKPVDLLRVWGTALGVRGVPTLVQHTEPDAIICTHFLPLEVLGPLRQRGGPPVYGVVTDYRAHRYWALPGVDGYFVPTPATRDQLVAAGVPRERIIVTGIPVEPPLHTFGAPAARAALHVPLHVPLVLINGSGLAAPHVRELVIGVLARGLPLTLLVAVGRNHALAAALANVRGNHTTTLQVLGPQPSLLPLIAASDVVVGKAGGLTVSEALAHGVPMLILAPAPGQEHANVDHLRAVGAGEYHASPTQMVEAIAAFVRDPAQRRALATAAKQAGRPAAARTIATHVLHTIERGYLPSIQR